MSDWLIFYNTNENKHNETPNQVQVCRDNVLYIESFSHRLRITFVDGSFRDFNLDEWDIRI